MRKLPYLLVVSSLIISLGFVACSDDDDDNVITPSQEFVADASSFAGFKSWNQPIGPHRGPDPAEIGSAHGADSMSIQRFIYINDENATRGADGNFPNGTIFIKQVVHDDGTIIATTVMAKRGGDFNTAHRGWEWFLLKEDGSIDARGADLFGGACNSCHEQNASKDYVWAK
jgi:cytochrome P460